MAVPKKRTGPSAQGKRRSNWKATKPEITTCPNCGAKALTHTVCTACGTYKGKVVSKKAEGYVEEVKEEKKSKKASKKADCEQSAEAQAVDTFNASNQVAEEVVETPAVEEAKVEEVKEEASTEE